eukprot:TRINITY_DN4106_c0_g1_i1.p2 TRINITY_DN4106_c0_g1~~TRINITY_DN4106_c0_g1_i1.p2  ORF type:complete len:375 (-),score=31.44 TRINITY_DN4106_c0_g1_i1:613-1737(-)
MNTILKTQGRSFPYSIQKKETFKKYLTYIKSQSELKVKCQLQKTQTWSEQERFKQESYKRQVLIAVDETQDSAFACQWTANEIFREGDFIHLLHTIPSYSEMVEEYPFGQRVLINGNCSDKGICPDCVDELKRRNIPFQVQVVREQHEIPSVSQAICDIAQDLHASMIIMSSHSKNFLQELFKGSHTNYCVHHCSDPVVVLHPPKMQGSYSRQNQLEGVRRIAVAVDNNTDTANQICDWAAKQLYREKDVFHIIHVVPDATPTPLMIGGLEGPVTVSAMNFQQDLVNQQTEAIKSMIVPLLQEKNIPYELSVLSQPGVDNSEAIGDLICSIAQDIKAGAIVIGSHNKGALTEFFMGSVTSHCTHVSKVPVVVLH